MRETGQASASFFQRRLRIGYTRAARLIALLESRGIVGPDRGSNEREILIDMGQRVRTSPPQPAPVPAPSFAAKNLEAEQQRLRAEQQKLEAQFRLQRVAATRPVPRRRRAPLAGFGCLQGCGCLLVFVVGLVFISGWSRSCTRSGDSPSQSTAVPPAQRNPYTPPDDGTSASPPSIRRALPVYNADQPATPAGGTLPGFYSVVGIDRNDSLNVHNGPGSNYQVVAKLPNGSQGIQIVGLPVMNGTTEWVRIHFKNQTGWVAKAYMKAQ